MTIFFSKYCSKNTNYQPTISLKTSQAFML